MENYEENDDLQLVIDEEYEKKVIEKQRAIQKELKERLQAEYVSAKLFTELYENFSEE